MTAMKEMFKEILEESLEGELDMQLGYEKSDRSHSKNRRNGHSTKTVRSELGEIEVSVPRDRNGEYEPKILPENSRSVKGLEDKQIVSKAVYVVLGVNKDGYKEILGIWIGALLKAPNSGFLC